MRIEEAQQGDAPLADQDDDGDGPPPRAVEDDRQPDERHAGHRLVRDRVGDLAEVGDQPALAGDVTVDLVGDHRHREDHPRDAVRHAIESPPSTSRAPPKNGTSTIRSMVR